MIASMSFLGIFISNQASRINLQCEERKLYFPSPEIAFILLIFSTFAAIRWQVGVDHLSYQSLYYEYASTGKFTRDIEPGYEFIVRMLTGMKLSALSFFFTFALLQIVLIYHRFKDDRYLYPYFGLFITCLSFLSMMNGMRQWLAAAIFIWATRYIVKRNIIKYLICIAIAYLFHKSAALLLILYLVPNKAIFPNRYVNIALLVGSVFIGVAPYWLQYADSASLLFTSIGYESLTEDYIEALYTYDQRDMSFGLQRSILLFIPILVSWFRSELSEEYKDRGFDYFFSMMMIGTIYFNLFANTSHIFLRPQLYFSFFTTISLSFLMVHLNRAHSGIVRGAIHLMVIIMALTYLWWSCYTGERSIVDYNNYKFIFNHSTY